MEDDMNDFEMIEFWGEEIPPGGKPSAVVVENEPPVFSMVHVTGCALGDAPKPGPHVLKALHQGKPIVLATLEKGGATQFRLDFGISSSATFINTGASPLYISGYITRSVQHIEGSDEEDDEDEDEDEDSEDDLEDSDDGEPPRLVPIRGAANGKAKRASPFVEDEAEETDEDDSDAEMEDDSSDEGEDGSSDEEEEEDEDEDFDRRLGAKSFGSDEEDEDEEGLPELNSDDLVAEADSDDEDEGEDDSDSDGPPPEQKSKAKRGAQPATPQPAKKQRKEDARVPASAPPKVQQQKQQQKGGGGGDPDAQYLAAIVDFLKSEGKPVPLAALGSHVKRPDGLKAKAKAFVVAHADRLAFDEKKQTVALKK